MTAKVLDAIEWNTYYLLKANGGDPKTPTRHPRPGDSTEPETVSLAQLGNYLKE